MLDVHISTEVSVIILQRSDASYTKPANLQCVTVACQCTNFLNFQLETADRADNYCWHMAPPPTGAHDKSRSWGNNLIAPCVLNNLENPISLWQQMLHNSLPLYLAVIINTWGVGRKWKRKKKKVAILSKWAVEQHLHGPCKGDEDSSSIRTCQLF